MLQPCASSVRGTVQAASVQTQLRRRLSVLFMRCPLHAPRCEPAGKGKQRETASAEFDWPTLPVSAHARWLPGRERLFMLNEVIPRRTSSGRIARLVPSTAPSHPRFVSNRAPHRRFASTAPALAPHPSIPPGHDPETALTEFRILLSPSTPLTDPSSALALYEFLSERDKLAVSLTTAERVSFADKIVTYLEDTRDRKTYLDLVPRLRIFLDDLAPTVPVQEAELDARYRQCTHTRVRAAVGDLSSARSSARDLYKSLTQTRLEGLTVPVFQSLLLAYWHHDSPLAALDFILNDWDVIWSLLHWRNPLRGHELAAISAAFRMRAFDIVESISRPAVFLAEKRDRWTKDKIALAGRFFLDVLCERELGDDALAVLDELKSQDVEVHARQQCDVVHALAKNDRFQQAITLFSALESVAAGQNFYGLTGLYLFSQQGDEARAAEYFHSVATAYDHLPSINMLIQASAVNGHVEEACRLFDRFYPSDGSGMRPDKIAYATMILAFARRGDLEGMNGWLEAMTEAGFLPDVRVYTIIAQSFAKRNDLVSVGAVLNQMRAAGIAPTVVTFTVIISLLASRRDPLAAEVMFKRAVSEGVVPDRRMVTALMNAHVEAGSWRGVIRVFDYLRQIPTRQLRLTIEVYNTLLKAYVLIGAPFDVVSNVFGRLEHTDVQPDEFTFCLLLQSACDAGYMRIATDIFREMEALTEKWQSSLHVNVYSMTILMAGFLRRGDKVRAKEMYDDMIARGIKPTSHTFSNIIRAYGNERSEDSLRIAEAFLQELVENDTKGNESWTTASGDRKAALVHVYQPLMALYRYRYTPEQIERLFQSMLAAGGQPTLGTLTLLLDAYRLVSNLDGVRKVWPQIYQLASEDSQLSPLFPASEDSPTADIRRQRSVLCIPLSIYIDCLSASGQHDEIPIVWRRLQTAGFSFDSHNWNHLAVAMTRAGQIERAFEVIERVLLPYMRKSQQLVMSRDHTPADPLLFQDGEAHPADPGVSQPRPSDAGLPEPLPEPHPGQFYRRESMVRKSSKLAGSLLDLNGEDPTDFAHPLHILHQIAPSWAVWRPHRATILVLQNVLDHLGAGMMVQPVAPSGANTPDPFEGMDVQEKQLAMATQAAELLERIQTQYRDAVSIVLSSDYGRRRDRQHTARIR